MKSGLFNQLKLLNPVCMVNFSDVVKDLRKEYCAPTDTGPEPGPRDDDDTCDVDEINAAKEFITDIDTVISDNLFKVRLSMGQMTCPTRPVQPVKFITQVQK